MSWLSCKIQVSNVVFQEVLIAELSQIGFDSFQQEDDRLLAFVEKSGFEQSSFEAILSKYEDNGVKSLGWEDLPDINWNEEWEKNFDPVEIADRIRIRAPFHESKPEFEFEILLTPKMAFGTGHHATTYQMLEKMLELDFKEKNVFDYGCGTGILLLLASKLGAKQLFGIDCEKQAIENATEILKDNECWPVSIVQGDKNAFKGKEFDIVLANINKNVLLDSLDELAASTKTKGQLLMSGILKKDLPDMLDSYSNYFQHIETRLKDDWAIILFERNETKIS